MGIRRAAEADRDAQDAAGELGNLVAVLRSGREMTGDVAVDVRLGHATQRSDLVAVGLEQHPVAEMAREPRQLGQEPRIAADQVVLEERVIVERTQPGAEHQVAFEAEQRRHRRRLVMMIGPVGEVQVAQ